MSSKLKTLTQEKIKSAKLSAIGRFAAHMVHDLRNPIYGLSLITSELKNLIKKDDPRYKYFNEIASGIERLSEIIEKIADHGRIYEPKIEGVDINKLIKDVAEEFKKANPCKIDLQLGEIGILMIDPAQWRRVFFNLFQNSYEAKKEDCRIVVRVNPCQHPHPSVSIEIADDLVIADLFLNEITGFDLYQIAKDKSRFIIITGFPEKELALKAKALLGDRFIPKCSHPEVLRAKVAEILKI